MAEKKLREEIARQREGVLQEMYKLVEVKILRNGVNKFTIPDDLFNGVDEVVFEGGRYDVWSVPGIPNHVAPRLIEMAIESYNTQNDAPSWSQTVAGDIFDQTNASHVSLPQTLYIK